MIQKWVPTFVQSFIFFINRFHQWHWRCSFQG